MSTGTDREGEAAVHAVWWENFRGLQRRVVVIWHNDDDDDDEKSKGRRGRRRREDREGKLSLERLPWFRAVTCSHGWLAVVATKASPVLPLLQGCSSKVGLPVANLVEFHRCSPLR